MTKPVLTPVNMDKDGNPTDNRGEWKRFLCRACGWIYDERLGDEDGGLPAGTRFEDIPDDWVCPLCGVTKRDFEPYVCRNEPIAKPVFNPCADDNGVIVIGGGTAGWTVVEALRKLNTQLPITLITADSGDRYFKPQLSIAISQNKTPDQLITQSAIQLAEKLNIGLIAHTFVMHIDSQKRQVRTTRGDFHYRHLVLALGATPALPACLPPDCVWRINHVDMFARLQEKLSAQSHQHVAIVGAGMVGVELAEDLVKAGHRVTLINRETLPLPEILPNMAGEKLKQALINTGIDYVGNAQLARVARCENGQYHLEFNGQTLLVDEVVASTGLMLNERLPKRAGLDHSPQGIVVDEQTLQTSNPDVFALGDCIAIGGQACRFVAPLREQANAIAHQIVGLEHAGYAHTPPLIRLKIKSVTLTITGNVDKSLAWQVAEDSPQRLLLTQTQNNQVSAKIELAMP